MDKIYEELVKEMDEFGLEFKEIPSIFLPYINDDKEPACKKAKITETEENKSELSNEDSLKNSNIVPIPLDVDNKAESLLIDETNPGPSKNINEPKSAIEKTQVEILKIENDEQSNKEDKNDDNVEEIDEDLGQPAKPAEGFCFDIDFDSSDMLDEIDLPEDGSWPTPTERYFTPYYQIDVQSPGDDLCILIHSNRICMITLAPSHIIFQENKSIKKVDFKVSEKLDRRQNKVSGKSKHGAQPLQTNSNLCCISCSDGTTYVIKCCMIGKLVEINDGLVDFPDMLKLEPHFGGYIAIVLPNLKHLDKLKEKLLNQEQYNEAIKKRTVNKESNDNIKTEEERIEEKEKLFLKYCEKMNADAEKFIREAEKNKQKTPETVDGKTNQKANEKT